MRLTVCPPRTPHRLRELKQLVTDWVSSPALAELVSLTDPDLELVGSTRDHLATLVGFSGAWDFRGRARAKVGQAEMRSQDAGGAARWLIEAADIDDATSTRIRDLADELGLVTAQLPEGRSFDYVLVLGGARLSNLLRPQRAAQLIRSAAIKAGELVLLAGTRPVMETERDATDTYAPSAATEFDLMNQGAATSFGLQVDRATITEHDDPKPYASWRKWSFAPPASELDIPVVSLAAPSLEPDGRRANSADSYAFFADHLGPQLGRSCLLVTSQIYVPYQHFEAVRNLALKFDLELETVGVPVEQQPSLQGMQSAVNYLQEVRSTILSMQRLYDQHLVDVD
jgi:hypothetical protein